MVMESVLSCELRNERSDTTIGDAKLKYNLMCEVEGLYFFSMNSERTVTGRVINVDVSQISVPFRLKIA